MKPRPKTGWILTASGRKFWPTAPRPGDIHVADFVHALANICRFGGHCRVHYSVLEHSIFVAEHVAPEHRLHALLHDAPEAYIGDMVNPLKLQMPEFQAVEARLWGAVCLRFKLDPRPGEAAVHHADRVAVMTERRDILVRSRFKWGPGFDEVKPSPLRCLIRDKSETKRHYLRMLNRALCEAS